MPVAVNPDDPECRLGRTGFDRVDRIARAATIVVSEVVQLDPEWDGANENERETETALAPGLDPWGAHAGRGHRRCERVELDAPDRSVFADGRCVVPARAADAAERQCHT